MSIKDQTLVQTECLRDGNDFLMPYLIYAIDHENKEDIRESFREAHRLHLRSVGERLLASGALLSDDQRTVIGGISLLDTESREEADSFAAQDPYTIAGIRQTTQILYWRKRWWEGHFLVAEI